MEKNTEKKVPASSCEQNNNMCAVLFALAFVVLVVLNIITIRHTSKYALMQAIQEIEAQKVGGEENYEILQKVYSDEKFAAQQKAQLEAGLKQIQGGAQPSAAPTPAANPSEPISSQEVSAVLEGIYPEGNTKAKFVLVEYSDFLCPFCQRQYTQGTIKKLRESFPDDIYTAFVPNTRGNPASLKIAVGAECAGEQGKFNEYIGEIFAMGASVNNMEKAAEAVGIDTTKYQACVDADTYADKVNKKMAEGTNLFGVRGTPGNVIINTETGEFTLIAGAFPYEEFASKLEAMMNK